MDFNNYGDAPSITPGATSYFSAPSSDLDPKLFQADHLNEWVRSGILTMLFEHLVKHYAEPHTWTHAWLAGSGVSFQWEASRDPGDLDCLIGIDYVKFRQSNPEFIGYSDVEISKTFNEGFHDELMPNTRNWEGYELTYYVNPQSNIRDINPYAAYDLTADTWTVYPDKNPQPPYSRAWEQKTMRDEDMTQDMLRKYSDALNEVRSTSNPAYRVNAERKLRLAAEQAVAFYDDIHHNRNIAFSTVGSGYADFNNYRWQAGKRSGVIQALRSIKEHKDAIDTEAQKQTYGVELPDAATLVRRTLRG
jgi:hypothetical protein